MSTWLKDTAERAIATAAQAALAVIGVDAVTDATAVDWQYVVGVAAGGAILSVLKSLAARTIADPDSASLVELDTPPQQLDITIVDDGGPPVV